MKMEKSRSYSLLIDTLDFSEDTFFSRRHLHSASMPKGLTFKVLPSMEGALCNAMPFVLGDHFPT